MLVIGDEIIALGLLEGAQADNLKHSSYDLTIGDIIPIGKSGSIASSPNANGNTKHHFLEPREMVLVISKESFRMPPNVTGFATLRTTFTKDGILALNVGIIDPFYNGPISTSLINFSNKPKRIDIGDKFFRVLFLQHEDSSRYHHKDESADYRNYKRLLEISAYSDFSESFLSIPNYSKDFYSEFFKSILFGFIRKNKIISLIIGFFIVNYGIFLYQNGFISATLENWNYLVAQIPKFDLPSLSE